MNIMGFTVIAMSILHQIINFNLLLVGYRAKHTDKEYMNSSFITSLV